MSRPGICGRPDSRAISMSVALTAGSAAAGPDQMAAIERPTIARRTRMGRGGRRLLAADDVLVGRFFFEETAMHHPVDLFLELGRLVALHAGQFGQEATLALLGLEVAQQLLARALLVLAQPGDG